jgi:hypothetical protein
MKFLTNEKLTLHTNLGQVEIIQKLNDAIEPIHPTEPIVVGLKPFVGTITGSSFEALKRVWFLRVAIDIKIRGSFTSKSNGTSIFIEINKKTSDLIHLLFASIIGFVALLILLFPSILETTKVGEVFALLLVFVSILPTGFIVFLKAEHAEKQAKQFFLELLQTKETTDAKHNSLTHE